MALTPEQKLQLIAELQQRPDITPEQKQRLGILWTKQLQKQDQPAQDVSMTPVTKPDLNQAGESIATSKFGQEHPIVGAAAGTVVSEADTLIPGALGLTKSALLAKGARGAVSKMTPEVLKSTGAEQVSALQEKAAELPVRFAEKAKMLEGLKEQAKTGIGMAEKAAGIEGMGGMPSSAMESLISNKDRLAKFADKMDSLTKKGAEYLAEKADLQTLQRFNKILQEGGKKGGLNDLTIANMNQSRTVIKDAIGLKAPGVKESLSAYKTIEQAIESLPKDQQLAAKSLRLALKKAQNLAKRQGSARKLAGKVVGGAATGLGLGVGAKMAGLY